MFRKLFSTGAAVLILLALSSVAHADPVSLVSIGGTGVDATITNYSLVGNTFTFTLNNTAVEPGATGTITSIGFALPGDFGTNFVLVAQSNPNYRIVFDVNPTAGAQNFVTNFDIALLTGPNFGGGGNPNQGILPGASATFSVQGNFGTLTAQQIAESIFARFQNVNGGGSDVARPVPGQPIPEPATMVLLGTGLAGVAARMRKRRKASKESTE